MSILFLIKNLVIFFKIFYLLSRFYNSELVINTVLFRRLNNSRSDIKIHTEIKLLFYYKVHFENVKSRVLYTNKNVCYLYDLFISIHKKFQILKTFEKFNKKWILSD